MTFTYRRFARTAITAAMFGVTGAGSALAYVGPSFVQIPGISGGWQGEKYKDWIRAEAQYWDRAPVGFGPGALGNAAANAGAQRAGGGRQGAAGQQANQQQGGRGRGRGATFSGPPGPRQGGGFMAISVDKKSPALAKLMEACTSKVKIPEMTYAESAVMTGATTNKGPKPSAIPDYFEYKLKDVELTCPVMAGAPEQGFKVKFADIQLTNYEGNGEQVTFEPKKLQPSTLSGETKAYVVQWIAYAHDVSDDQCPVLSSKPELSEYYKLLSKDEAAKDRAAFGEKGVSYENGSMERRGPDKLNVCKLPGIMPDPGHASPVTKIARGINVDGHDGSGATPANTCKHPNFVSADGKQSGIDNQLYMVQGCTPAYMGHKGFYFQYSNEQRRNGMLAIMLEVAGIEDPKNDNNVEVNVLYSQDPMAKDATGLKILPDYTFRVTDNPTYTHYFAQLKGKIVDGVLTTEPVDVLRMNHGMDIEIEIFNAAFRMDIQDDGSMKGVLGGYIDWRKRLAVNMNSNQENLYGFKCPGLYQAFKNAADGLKDPVTGECNGISAAYDVEVQPAFIPPAQRKAIVADAR